MKCVGSDNGTRQCQRCKRANVECVFEKHRRGRKPGSKLSEASKLLRRLEKGLNSAKPKQQSDNTISSPYPMSDSRTSPSGATHYAGMLRGDSYGTFNSHFPSIELPPLNLPSGYSRNGNGPSSSGSRGTMDMDDDDDNGAGDEMFPAKLIKKENQRHSFFRTILNPEHERPPSSATTPTDPLHPAPIPADLDDPISAGIIDEGDASVIFEMVFLRLNPFINLFDPSLHTVAYVRSKCPLLFSTLIMAGAKFFRPEIFKQCQKLANDLAVRAFADGWKRVEVVQAFACLTYWKEPDDNRTWTYIGYACRMAVELGLNRHVERPSAHESPRQLLERRNRERTYLVLWVHDRSLSTQTGRHCMLPEDELVRKSGTWHLEGDKVIRPEDVILAAFVGLRRIAAETTEIFYSSTGLVALSQTDINYDVVLGNCNRKLNAWSEQWKGHMKRANGESFHESFLSLFSLYIRLFLNSFGIQAAMQPGSHTSPSVQALTACYSSATETLRIVSQDFAKISMLRYGQETITMMSAYAAVVLLRLLNSTNTLDGMPQEATQSTHNLIMSTSEAYFEAARGSPSTSALCHARFLRNLVTNDIFKARAEDKERLERLSADSRMSDNHSPQSPHVQDTTQMYAAQNNDVKFNFPALPHMPSPPAASPGEFSPGVMPGNAPQNMYFQQMNGNGHGNGNVNGNGYSAQQSSMDQQYWRNIFSVLGFGAGDNSAIPQFPAAHSHVRGTPYETDDMSYQQIPQATSHNYIN